MKELYGNRVVEMARSLVMKEILEGREHSFKVRNPFCGDQFELGFDLVDNRIEHIELKGFACILSKSSSYWVITTLSGLNVEEAKESLKLLSQGSVDDIVKEYSFWKALSNHPDRKECIQLLAKGFYSYLQKPDFLLK